MQEHSEDVHSIIKLNCTQCGTENEAGAQVCKDCGASLEEARRQAIEEAQTESDE